MQSDTTQLFQWLRICLELMHPETDGGDSSYSGDYNGDSNGGESFHGSAGEVIMIALATVVGIKISDKKNGNGKG